MLKFEESGCVVEGGRRIVDGARTNDDEQSVVRIIVVNNRYDLVAGFYYSLL